jgi:tetratricopeptide (TPR) repeat protein/DNA-binding XRE family transcriptional regulator
MVVLFHHQLLAKVRVELGLTQEDAAHAVGVDVRTYRRYESGEVNESGGFAIQRASRRKILERICRELGIEAGELLLERQARTALPATLPRARHFVGRTSELARLHGWLGDAKSRCRVLAVVAMGGAGKTSLVEQALSRCESSHGTPPFVHSFYEEPSVDAFLEGAARYLEQAGGEPLDNVVAGLRATPDVTLVLDGLELVQANGQGERARGELEDRRLARLFRGVVQDRALGRLLVTTRFPLADLAAFEHAELETLSLSPLDARETIELLRRWGIRGADAALERVCSQTGGHALSVAVMGSYAGELLNGDLSAAGQLELADAARDQPLARRLRAILAKYAAELAPLERALLAHVSLFSRGIDAPGLLRLPPFRETASSTLRAALGRLVHRGLAVMLGERYSAHPFIREHFSQLVGDAAAVHELERSRLAAELDGHPARGPYARGLLDTYEQLFEHTMRAGDAAEAYRLTQRAMGGFAQLGLRLGDFERGLRLSHALESAVSALPPDAQWRVTYDRGLYAAALGDLDGALRAYRTLLARDDQDAVAHRTLAYTLRLRGELESAHVHVERSIELGRRDAAVGTIAKGLALRGALLTSEARLVEAGAAFDEARALGDQPTARRSIWEAEYLLAKGELDEATSRTLSNLHDCEQRGWSGHVAHCHVILGRAAVGRGALDDAEASLDSALDWCLRSREVELTLEAKLLELALARATHDAARAAQAHAQLHDAAVVGGFGAMLRLLAAHR